MIVHRWFYIRMALILHKIHDHLKPNPTIGSCHTRD